MDLIFALTNSEGAIHAVNYQLGNFEKKFRIKTGVPISLVDLRVVDREG